MSAPAGASARKTAVRAFYERLWNSWDLDAIPELLSEDLRFRGSLGHEKRGHDGFAGYVEMIRAAFPDFHNRVEDLWEEDDTVVARLTWSGTHEGEIFGLPPTGRRIEYVGVGVFHFADARIDRVWVLGDMLGLMRQVAQVQITGIGVDEEE